MVEDSDGEWIHYEDMQLAMIYVAGYLSEHKGLLEDLRAHKRITDSVQYIIDQVTKL